MNTFADQSNNSADNFTNSQNYFYGVLYLEKICTLLSLQVEIKHQFQD
jgi:hypothetical protein